MKNYPISNIQYGMMNGSNDAVMKSLYNTLPTKLSDTSAWEASKEFMSELWLRGITKEQFTQFVKSEK